MEVMQVSDLESVRMPDDGSGESVLRAIVIAGRMELPVGMHHVPGGVALHRGFRRVAAAQEGIRRGILPAGLTVRIRWEIQAIVKGYAADGSEVSDWMGWVHPDNLAETVRVMRATHPRAVRMTIDLAL
jgi:hypothetical protein